MKRNVVIFFSAMAVIIFISFFFCEKSKVESKEFKKYKDNCTLVRVVSHEAATDFIYFDTIKKTEYVVEYWNDRD